MAQKMFFFQTAISNQKLREERRMVFFCGFGVLVFRSCFVNTQKRESGVFFGVCLFAVDETEEKSESERACCSEQSCSLKSERGVSVANAEHECTHKKGFLPYNSVSQSNLVLLLSPV